MARQVSDFATTYTLSFVRRHLEVGRRRLLEVGCGDGRLARALLELGYDVVGIDSDAQAVAAAREHGVAVVHAAWPQVELSGFDAVLFTRSLHHVHPLVDAVDRAWAALDAGGKLIVEDFGYGDVDRRTIEWFAGTMRVLRATGALDDFEPWLKLLAESDEPRSVWMAHHDHGLSSIGQMEAAVTERFGTVERQGAAYFFRYLRTAFGALDRRERLVEALARLEAGLEASGAIQALGQRLVARKRA